MVHLMILKTEPTGMKNNKHRNGEIQPSLSLSRPHKMGSSQTPRQCKVGFRCGSILREPKENPPVFKIKV